MGVSKYLKNFLLCYGLAWVVGSLVVFLSPQAFMSDKEAYMALNFFGPMASVMLLAGVFLMVLGIRSVMRQHQFDLSVWGDLRKNDLFPFCLGVIVVALLALLILEYIGIADMITRTVVAIVVVLSLIGVYFSIRLSMDMYRSNLEMVTNQVRYLAGERQLKRLFEKLILHAKQHGHNSEEVKTFVEAHKGVPEFTDLSTGYLRVLDLDQKEVASLTPQEQRLCHLLREFREITQKHDPDCRQVFMFVRLYEEAPEFRNIGNAVLMLVEITRKDRDTDELAELLTDLVEIAEEHGHDSEEVRNFFQKNGHLSNVRKVGEKILLSLKRV